MAERHFLTTIELTKNHEVYFFGKMTRRRGTARLTLLLSFGLVIFCNSGGSPDCLELPLVLTGGLTEATTGRGEELAAIRVMRSVRPLMLTVSDWEPES